MQDKMESYFKNHPFQQWNENLAWKTSSICPTLPQPQLWYSSIHLVLCSFCLPRAWRLWQSVYHPCHPPATLPQEKFGEHHPARLNISEAGITKYFLEGNSQGNKKLRCSWPLFLFFGLFFSESSSRTRVEGWGGGLVFWSALKWKPKLTCADNAVNFI